MFGKKLSGKMNFWRKTRERGVAKIGTMSDDTYGEIVPNEKLQDRLVQYFANDDNVAAAVDEDAVVPEGQRLQVKKAFETEQIPEYRVVRFLLQVLSPIQDLKTNLSGIYQQIVREPRQKQILAVITGHGKHNWQQVDEEDLRNLLSKPQQGHVDYRTPAGFDAFRKKFLAGIAEEATPEQMDEYRKAMDEVERALYGRRFEYYQQMVLMSRTQEKPVELNGEPKSAEVAEPTAQILENAINVGLVRMDEARSSEVLGKAVIEGDAWIQDGTEYRLTAQGLMSAGVAPVFEGVADGRRIFLSEGFRLSDGRGAIIGYVEDGEAMKVRGFCQNLKDGMWYYVPETIRGARGEGITQIGEGYGEDSVRLALAVQAMIAQVIEQTSLKTITMVNADFLLAGTAAAYNTQQEYREALSRGMARGDYYREVDNSPLSESWRASGRGKSAPQLISVNNEILPDFQRMAVEFRTYSVLVGQEEIRGFWSNDGQLIWGMGNDEWGRVWCSNIEINSPMTSTGCRRDWMDAGDMVTPLYENSTQAGEFGDARDIRRGMVGMWAQYVSRIPLMQEYVKWRNEARQIGG